MRFWQIAPALKSLSMLPKHHTSQINKPQLEQLWVNKAAAAKLSTSDLHLWANLGSTHRIYIGIGRTLLVWQAVNSSPRPVYSLTISEVRGSFHQGLELLLRRGAEQTTVGHTPTKLPEVPCFAWVPCFSEVRWAPADYNRPDDPKFFTVPLCVKMLSNPSRSLVEGGVYVSSVMEFRQDWPQFKHLQF